MTIDATMTLIDLAAYLGTQAGEASDPTACDDLREAAGYLRACAANGVSPERDSFGETDEMHALLLGCQGAGMPEAELRRLRRAYSAAAHDAEDLAILAAEADETADAEPSA